MNYNKIYYENNKEHIKQLVRDRYKMKKDEIDKKEQCNLCGRIVIGRMIKKHWDTAICNRIKNNKIEKKKKIKNVPEFPLIKIKKDGWVDFK